MPSIPASHRLAPQNFSVNSAARLPSLFVVGVMMAMLIPPMVSWGGDQSTATDVDASPVLTGEAIDFFESKVRPLLIEHCYECHSVESGESSGELLLDSAAAMLRGGSMGPTFVSRAPDKSLLMRAVDYQDADLQMPPEGKLNEESIETLRQWIALGAPDPRVDATGHELQKTESPLERDPATHWAFRTPRRAPRVDHQDAHSRDVIDDWASAWAAKTEIRVNSQADHETLVRRLYFDLTGLPPTAAVIERFVTDDRPDAYTRLVDSLLASPEFGERFGRHWMDVSRYADTLGYATAGKTRRHVGSERFRDWVIRAFAGDLPYDQMLRHQLAGDRTDPNNENGNLDAMGFLTLGRKFLNPLDTLDDRIDVISRGLLGMTVACARCHDHKFDPIPTSDYYSLAGILYSSQQPKDGASPLMMVDKKNPIDSPVLIRGQLGNHGPVAPRQFLTALRKVDEPRFSDGSGRKELVDRITDSDNPLTSRVMVNRLWAQLIGKPLVDSPSDFGFRTSPPAVPQVLDDLAAEFASHWSVKRIVRRIVLSRIYRQTSEITTESQAIDPDNVGLARANRRRRDFESLRDGMLNVSGMLDRRLGGEPVEITLSTPAPRRTVYAMIDRQNLPALFRTFDFASPDTHSPRRYYTTVPQQALHLLNNGQVHELTRRTANLVSVEVPHSDDRGELAKVMFRRVLGRQPNASELQVAKDFLNSPSTPPQASIDARSLWTYGTATMTDEGTLGHFKPFAVFEGSRWQSESVFPSKGPMGYASLTKDGGHTANDLKTLVVRRFTAPADGFVTLRGMMGHRSKEGDGVRAEIWVGGKRLFQGTQKSNNRPIGPVGGRIAKGQTLDLAAAAGESSSFDSFFWNVKVRFAGDDQKVVESDSVKHFSGPFDPESLEPLDRLAQLAQVLLMSNEFAFVD